MLRGVGTAGALAAITAQPIRIEDFVEGDHYLVRAELAGIDPEKDVEVTVGSGYLTIRAERHDKTEGKHRTEFRYGSFSRSLPLPGDANADDVTATFDHGILTVSVGLKAEKKDEVKKIPWGQPKEAMIDTLTWLLQVAGGDSGGGFLSTHPATEDRIDALRKLA